VCEVRVVVCCMEVRPSPQERKMRCIGIGARGGKRGGIYPPTLKSGRDDPSTFLEHTNCVTWPLITANELETQTGYNSIHYLIKHARQAAAIRAYVQLGWLRVPAMESAWTGRSLSSVKSTALMTTLAPSLATPCPLPIPHSFPAPRWPLNTTVTHHGMTRQRAMSSVARPTV